MTDVDRLAVIERKVAVIDAVSAWIEAIQAHGPGAARPFRDNFLMALDDALTATDRGAVDLAERYGEAILAISATLNNPDLGDGGRINRLRAIIASLDTGGQ
jgi:hypothetical protein